ncbi:MAG: rhodanese-like domain-containing protein, partial [Rikenellaceae bacterium]
MSNILEPKEFLAGAKTGVIIDVRSPSEFKAGHIEGAYNIPLFSDSERAVVGTIYKQVGKEEAVEKG